MNTAFKRTFAILFAAAIAVLGFMYIGTGNVYADVKSIDITDALTSEGAVVFDDNEYLSGRKFYTTWNESEMIESTESSDTEVAYAEFENDTYNSCITIYPVGPGECTVRITGKEGGTLDVPVRVTKDFVDQLLKSESVFGRCNYGFPNIIVGTLPGVKVTVTVGTKKYSTVTANSSGIAKIKLGKVYPLNAKVSAKISYKGSSRTLNSKLYSCTKYYGVKSSASAPKKVKVECTYLHKGDIVKVKYKGKTYSTKIKKNYNTGVSVWVTVKIGAKCKANSKMKVWIVNKDNKTHLSSYVTLRNWYGNIYGSDEND